MNEDDENVDFEALVNDDTPMVIPKRRGVEDYRLLISAAWQKAVPSILETAVLCRDAAYWLTPGELRDLKQQLPFTNATYSKLKTMGDDKRLHRIADQLPASWTIISDLQRLSDATLNKAVQERVITPSLQRQQLRGWLAANNALPKRAKVPSLASLPLGFQAGIRVPHGYPEERLDDFRSALEGLCNTFGVQLVRQEDQELARVLGFIKAEAAAAIKKERLARRAVARKHDKAGSWPFAWSEVSVGEARTADDVKFMFQQLEMEHVFDVIIERARNRLARRLHDAELRERSEAEPPQTPDQVVAEIREALANVRRPSFLLRRRKVLDFELKDEEVPGVAGPLHTGTQARDGASVVSPGGDSISSPALVTAVAEVRIGSDADVSPEK